MRWLSLVIAVLGIGVLGTEMALASIYMGSALPGSRLAGENVTGRDRISLEHLAEARTRGYKIKLENTGGDPVVAYAEEMGISFDPATTASSVLSRPSGWMIASYIGRRNYEYGLSYRLDYTRLKQFVDETAGDLHVDAKDALIEMHEGKAVIIAQEDGLVVNQEQLLEDVVRAVERRSVRVALVTKREQAIIKSSDLKTVASHAEALAASSISFTFEERVWRPTRTEIGRWVEYTAPDGMPQVTIDPIKVEEYLTVISRSVDIKPINKSVTLINGEVKAEEGGKNGRALDKKALAKAVAEQLAPGKTISLNAPVQELAYKTVYNRTISIASGRYVEINLSLQRMWAYQYHEVVYSSPITSGATGAGFPTVQGLFSVQAKQRNRNLNGYAIGYDYNVFVQYWMPFYRDYGMHDASWRSSFGGSDYYYGGSHGCVNMPTSTAAWLYDWASVGTPVWVHS